MKINVRDEDSSIAVALRRCLEILSGSYRIAGNFDGRLNLIDLQLTMLASN